MTGPMPNANDILQKVDYNIQFERMKKKVREYMILELNVIILTHKNLSYYLFAIIHKCIKGER